MFRIWVDADACPRDAKRIVFRASQRVGVGVVVVADRVMPVPQTELVEMVRVPAGLDEADSYILDKLDASDIVITADIPLASEVVKKGAVAINPRGRTYTENNVAERLSTRNLMKELRDGGVIQGGPAPLRKADNRKFADSLDRLLTKKLAERKSP